jgi:crotonobetainyl-CoA:carnitine CoA-transferase CaiB-like acyl-CoA transferase
MPRNPLAGIYRTADDRFLVFSMLQGFHYWPEVCERIGRPDLITDPRFGTDSDTYMDNAPAAGDLLASELASKPLTHWIDAFTGMKGQWAVAQDTLEVGSDPQTVANGYLQHCETADGKPYQLVATPVQFDEEPTPVKRGPSFNEHGDTILTEELGMDWDTVIDLKVRGVVA